MKGFLGVTQFLLPFHCLEQAYFQFRKAGVDDLESIALFAGRQEKGTFTVVETIVPKHHSFRSLGGHSFKISAETLYWLNVHLHYGNLTLMAQIHSHPKEAFHSPADDSLAVITIMGGLSIVVPNYGTGKIGLDDCAIFRLSEDGQWLELTTLEINQLITII